MQETESLVCSGSLSSVRCAFLAFQKQNLYSHSSHKVNAIPFSINETFSQWVQQIILLNSVRPVLFVQTFFLQTILPAVVFSANWDPWRFLRPSGCKVSTEVSLPLLLSFFYECTATFSGASLAITVLTASGICLWTLCLLKPSTVRSLGPLFTLLEVNKVLRPNLWQPLETIDWSTPDRHPPGISQTREFYSYRCPCLEHIKYPARMSFPIKRSKQRPAVYVVSH